MAQWVGRDGCWIHIFNKTFFGGRGRLLAPGQREQARKIGSVIVGPAAIAEVLNFGDRQVMKLPQRKVIADFSKFIANKQASQIRVAKAPVLTPAKRFKNSSSRGRRS